MTNGLLTEALEENHRVGRREQADIRRAYDELWNERNVEVVDESWQPRIS
jgi:hypothetical protein